MFGQMADVGALAALAKKHGLMLVEDAAQAIGARRKVDGQWRAAGELGTVGSFSFFPTKNLGAWGDGGMMVAQDDTLADRLRRERHDARQHALERLVDRQQSRHHADATHGVRSDA